MPKMNDLQVFFSFPRKEEAMKRSEEYRTNADHCADLADKAHDEPSQRRYRRMEAAWLALAEEQDWLDGETSPSKKPPR